MKGSNLNRRLSGFTLLEVIVVIAILGVLMGILVPTISGWIEHARNVSDAANAKVICSAIQVECAEDPERLELYTHNQWGAGRNADGSYYEADDHGYIYVSHDEVRVSSYALGKILEANGYIKDAGDGKAGEIHQYIYKGENIEAMRCRSNRTWYRYQINVAIRGADNVYFTYSANSKSGEKNNTSKMSLGTNKHDYTASRTFATMAGGTADDIISLPELP